MEPLQLFPRTQLLREDPEACDQVAVESSEPIMLISAEHLEVAEAYLGKEDHADGTRARIETAMFLCEGAGEVGSATLQRLKIDRGRFPRAAAAVDETRQTLELPPSEWPQGFWSRFLLRVLVAP
jgi:hypothetical protein